MYSSSWPIPANDLARIASEMLRILEDTGMRFESDRILQLLERDGARVDRSSQVARFPARMIEDTIEWQKRQKDARLQFVGGPFLPVHRSANLELLLGTQAPFYYEWEKRNRRPARREDLVHMIQLADAMRQVTWVGVPLVDHECAPEVEAIQACALLVQNTRKPGTVQSMLPEQVKYIAEIGSIVSGVEGDPRFLMPYHCTTSPLIMGKRSCDCMLEMAGYEVPCVIAAMPIAGANAPVTAAGCISIGGAEILGGWMAARAISRETVVFGFCISGAMDMATGRNCFARSQPIIQDLTVQHLFRELYDGVVVIDPTYTDAKAPGLQAAFERTMRLLAFTSLDATLVFTPLGTLDAVSTFSPVQAMLDAEMFAEIMELHRGLDVNDDLLAADVTSAVVSAGTGSFLDCEHTLRHFRKQLVPDRLFESTAWSGGEAEDLKAKQLLERADEKWRSLLKSYEPMDIGADMRKMIGGVVERAVKDLA